jgi:ribosome-associated protein
MMDFELRGVHITLDALLKATGLAHSGGAAKVVIAAGQVSVDGEPELRRGRKLRADCIVRLGDHSVRVIAANSSANSGDSDPTKTNPSEP